MKNFLIKRFAMILFSKEVWDKITVLTLAFEDNTELTGSQKREAVVRTVKGIFTTIATQLLNLGVELALTYIRNKYPQ